MIDFQDNVAGSQAGLVRRRGRIDLSYQSALNLSRDIQRRPAIGVKVGYRHAVKNILAGVALVLLRIRIGDLVIWHFTGRFEVEDVAKLGVSPSPCRVTP